ncbi:MAG: protein kinase, partial [Candidatus Eisenbacteria bacterium]
MPLTAGTRLGPYEIVAPLGAGGMGEVYRARDTRLARDVAIKVLPESFARDPERLARFESEAKTIATLSHANVLAIHDFGTEGAVTFAVTELIEGQSLRERLTDGPLAAARATALAAQIAHGLAAAHDRGVVLRDLTPDNVMLTPDGRAKILDFGLAKRDVASSSGSHSFAPTVAASTEPGTVLGTTAYMSPEQVRGQAVDARSDLFSFGVLLYEMLTGRQPFRGESAADTMTAILREDPAPLATFAPESPPGLQRIVERCLEKQPAARFRTAADLAFALEALASGSSSGSQATASLRAASRVRFQRLTFRNGHIAVARFTPDGAAVVYGAAWDGGPHEIYTSRTGSAESRGLGLPAGSILAMSSTGEMAVSLDYHHSLWFQVSGTLARVALAGGGVRPLQKDVGHADWSPDGKSMAVIRYVGRSCQLEYPPGKVLFEAAGWLHRCRVSPDGTRVAFANHLRSGEGEADLCVVDRDGASRVLLSGMVNLSGIAWSPSGDEVWVSGIDPTLRHGIWAVTLDGQVRELHVSATRLSLQDVRPDGRALLTMDELRTALSAGDDSDAPATELAWFDGSVVCALSPDGEQMVFAEVAEAENPHYATYLRGFDGAPAVRLGEGIGEALSRNGQWVIAMTHTPRRGLLLYPTGFGEPREFAPEGIEQPHWAGFDPDNAHAFVVGKLPAGGLAIFRAPLAGGVAELLWDEPLQFNRFLGVPISPDG